MKSSHSWNVWKWHCIQMDSTRLQSSFEENMLLMNIRTLTSFAGDLRISLELYLGKFLFVFGPGIFWSAFRKTDDFICHWFLWSILNEWFWLSKRLKNDRCRFWFDSFREKHAQWAISPLSKASRISLICLWKKKDGHEGQQVDRILKFSYATSKY